jgi:AcrR family transcriptional regulator
MVYQRTTYVENKRIEARERLVQAARELVAQGGWREVQISAVAAAAGLSTGAVYLHFPSKTHLLAEVYRTQANAELRVVADIAAQPVSAAERLSAAIRAFAQRAMSNRRLAYAMVIEPTDTEVEEERLHFHTEFSQQFRRILEAGQAAGEFDVDDTRVAAACIFGCITESLMNPLGIAARSGNARSGGRNDAKILVDHVLAFCFRGIGMPKASARGGTALRLVTKPKASNSRSHSRRKE